MSLYDQKDTPGRCICEKGWSGDDCNICQPYPGCINGDCATIEGEKRPWTCTCNEGFEYGYDILNVLVNSKLYQLHDINIENV